ncbi:MAG TPA: hypothetical protein VHW00_22755 [Thermoanaerobaculia bacterium]|nr:hypothetical protein [Thermoanaerobaculia bacterium]
MTEAQRDRLLLFIAIIAIGLAAIGPIRNYDLFWHLATGRWIAAQHALPLVDPFTIASDRVPWINGEWLFQLLAYALVSIGGLTLPSLMKGLLAAATFAPREARPATIALHVLAFAGAMRTFDFRPSSVAALFVALAITARSWIAHGLIAMLWINMHPSALLAPVIALLVTRRVAPVLASALALLLNPHGVHAILAPLELLSFVQSGAFVNAEWLPSQPAQFPLLYIAIAIAALVFFANRERNWMHVALLVLFAALAIRGVRHQPLFFAAFPLLVAPALRFERLRSSIAYAASALMLVFAVMTTEHALGVSPRRFPIEAVARLQSTGLHGNIYNPDQFGGFLIWSFPNERRVLTDGRNELYRSFIPEYAAARADQRQWVALLHKYRIDLAVDEYRPPLQLLNGVTRARMSLPASLAYWPRERWALIGYDEAAMVFARRDAFPREVLEMWEIRGVVPDAER